MKQRNVTILLSCIACLCFGEEAAKAPNWHFFGSVVYTSRSLDGVIGSKNAISDGVDGDMFTTGDAMGVDDSNGAMLSIGAQYKRLGIGLNYMPTSFKGSGSALVAVGNRPGRTSVAGPAPLVYFCIRRCRLDR